MYKYYDVEKAKKLIEENKDEIVEASLFMMGDYFWAGVTVWTEKDGYIIDLDNTHAFAGLVGSIWATPSLELYRKDATKHQMQCFISEEDIDEELANKKDEEAELEIQGLKQYWMIFSQGKDFKYE